MCTPIVPWLKQYPTHGTVKSVIVSEVSSFSSRLSTLFYIELESEGSLEIKKVLTTLYAIPSEHVAAVVSAQDKPCSCEHL